jgi:hypothetical protein
MPKLALANGLWISITQITLPNLTMVEETLSARYCCQTILFKLIYTNKGGIIGQHALKSNVVIFAQDLECAIEILNELPLSLESLFDFIAVHFVGNTHLSMEIIKNCKFLYVKKCVITIWLTWLISSHTKYKCMTINRHSLNSFSNNNILDLIMRSILKSTNIELVSAKHQTNIIDLHKQVINCKINQTNKINIE